MFIEKKLKSAASCPKLKFTYLLKMNLTKQWLMRKIFIIKRHL